jgi:hypothetical protein
MHPRDRPCDRPTGATAAGFDVEAAIPSYAARTVVSASSDPCAARHRARGKNW